MLLYRETYRSSLTGMEAALDVVRFPEGDYALIAWLPDEVDAGPHVFATGSIADCRAAYPGAKRQMQEWFPE